MRYALLAMLLATVPAAAQTVAERLPTCLACHGETGASATEGVPSLGAMPADYVLIQLYLFREKQRKVEIMNAMAAGLTDDDLRTVADAIAALPPPKPAGAQEAAEAEQGRALAARYRCGSCHNADYAGRDQMPRLAGQREDYLLKSLQDYKSNVRAGYDASMNEVAQEVRDADIPVLARYLARFR